MPFEPKFPRVEWTTVNLNDYTRLKEIAEASLPFAALAEEVDRLRHSDDSTCLHRLRAGDIRRLRDALGGRDA